MPSHKVKLEICGSSYVVSTNDSEEYLLGLAEKLDADMNQLMLDSPNASVTAAAVITALGYLDEAEKNAFGADNMRAQIQDYLEDAAKARLDAEAARSEAERMRGELAYYKDQVEGKTIGDPLPEADLEPLLELVAETEAEREADAATEAETPDEQLGLEEL